MELVSFGLLEELVLIKRYAWSPSLPVRGGVSAVGSGW